MFHKLVMENYLTEEIIINQNDFPQAYIRVGPKIAELMTSGSRTKIMFAVMDDKSHQRQKKVEVAAVDTEDNELVDKCYHELVEVAQQIAEERGLTLAQVMNMQAIREMSNKMPESENEMLKIAHVTKANFDKYGQRFLNITMPYSVQRTLNAMDKDEQDEAEGSQCEEGDGTDWQAVGRAASSTNVSQGSAKRKFPGSWGKAPAKKYRTATGRAKKKSPAKRAAAKKPAGKNLMPRPRPQF